MEALCYADKCVTGRTGDVVEVLIRDSIQINRSAWVQHFFS